MLIAAFLALMALLDAVWALDSEDASPSCAKFGRTVVEPLVDHYVPDPVVRVVEVAAVRACQAGSAEEDAVQVE